MANRVGAGAVELDNWESSILKTQGKRRTNSFLVRKLKSWKDNWFCSEGKTSVLDFRDGTVLKVKRSQNMVLLACGFAWMEVTGIGTRLNLHGKGIIVANECHRMSVIGS